MVKPTVHVRIAPRISAAEVHDSEKNFPHALERRRPLSSFLDCKSKRAVGAAEAVDARPSICCPVLADRLGVLAGVAATAAPGGYPLVM